MLKRVTSLFVVGLVFFGLHSSVSAESHGEPPIKELESQFHELIYQEKTDDGKVKNYDSKAALEEDFQSIMKAPIADFYLDKYFKEKEGDLYGISMNGPHEIQFENEYELKKISDTYYRVIQPLNKENATPEIVIDYSYEAGKWVIANRMNHVATEVGGELPETNSSLPMMMGLGAFLMAAGGGLFLTRRRTARK